MLRYRKKPIVLLALVALLVAQLAAELHTLGHFGSQGDPLEPPGHHAQVCLVCASFASLDTTHAGGVTAFAVAALGSQVFVRAAHRAQPARTPYLPFRSRAPPR